MNKRIENVPISNTDVVVMSKLFTPGQIALAISTRRARLLAVPHDVAVTKEDILAVLRDMRDSVAQPEVLPVPAIEPMPALAVAESAKPVKSVGTKESAEKRLEQVNKKLMDILNRTESDQVTSRTCKIILDQIRLENDMESSKTKQFKETLINVVKIYKSCIYQADRAASAQGLNISIMDLVNKQVREEALKNPACAAILGRYQFNMEFDEV